MFNIQKLQATIRIYFPGFAVISAITKWKEDPKIETACTDGREIRYSPKFMAGLTEKEQTFVGLHEILHIVRKHMLSRGHRDHRIWNQATDYYINALLKKTVSRAKMPETALYNRKFEDWSEFEIYDYLVQNPKEQKSDTPGIGDVEDAEGDPSELHRQGTEIDKAIQTAAVLERMAGHGDAAGIFETIAGEARKPTIDWRTVLRRWMTTLFPTMRTWRNLDRRMWAAGVTYPGPEKTGTQELVFAVDCSGSVPRQIAVDTLAETVNAKCQCDISRMHILYFTSRVDAHDIFDSSHDAKIRDDIPSGGTSLPAVVEYIREHIPTAKGLICLTDGDCGYYPSDCPVPVVWGMLERHAKIYPPPFGDLLIVPEDLK